MLGEIKLHPGKFVTRQLSVSIAVKCKPSICELTHKTQRKLVQIISKDALRISSGGCRQSCVKSATNWDAYLRLREEIKGLIFKFS